MNVYFALIKEGICKLHQSSNRKLWEDFINGKTTNIPDVIIADANDFFRYFSQGLTVDECSECHFWDYEEGVKKICYNLSDEVLTWETIDIKEK